MGLPLAIGAGLAVLGSKEVIVKILGPTADYLGGELRTYTEKGAANLRRIFSNAEKKLGDRLDQPGQVPPKVLKNVLAEGYFSEDELAAEYFGGVLASSRSEVSRDDRVGLVHWSWWLAALPLEYGVIYSLYMTIDGALYRAGFKKVGGYARFTQGLD